MTVILICLLVVVFLPFVAKIPLAIAMKQQGGYDNHHPRTQQAGLTGFGARALAAHQNAFEAIIIFTPAVLVAIITQQIDQTVQWAAIAFVGARLCFNLFYLINQGLLRSTSWIIGTICSFYIFIQAIAGVDL